MDPALFDQIIASYKKYKGRDLEAFYAYAEDMGLQKVATAFME
jgi:hypothetical protein